MPVANVNAAVHAIPIIAADSPERISEEIAVTE